MLLLESCFAAAPVVLGHFRPLILMPIGLLAGLPPAQVEAVLVHELAHIRRHDYLMNLLQQVVEGLLFYHPAVWWFSRVMRNEREKCCDEVVVSVTGQAHEYALALVALEQNRFSGRLPAIAVSGGNLMKRIHRLLYPELSSACCGPLLALAIFLASAGLSLAAWPSEPSKESPTASQSRAGSAATSSYSKWLNEDVVYIIDDAERAAFQKLTTDRSATISLSSSGSVEILLLARHQTSSKRSTTAGLLMPTSIFGQRPVRRAGRPTAGTCLLFTVPPTRSTPTPKGRRHR